MFGSLFDMISVYLTPHDMRHNLLTELSMTESRRVIRSGAGAFPIRKHPMLCWPFISLRRNGWGLGQTAVMKIATVPSKYAHKHRSNDAMTIGPLNARKHIYFWSRSALLNEAFGDTHTCRKRLICSPVKILELQRPPAFKKTYLPQRVDLLSGAKGGRMKHMRRSGKAVAALAPVTSPPKDL